MALTGEITLRGRVLPIGGLKEKVLAAHRIGITTILLPDDNRSDLADIPPEVRRRMTFTFVKSMDEVIAAALLPRDESRPSEEGVEEPALDEEPAAARAAQRNRPIEPQPSL